MATYNEHIGQAKKNLKFLSSISSDIDECWDWQVTVCFYSACHLINAHLAKKSNCNYLSHKEVDSKINPFYPLSITKLDEDTYTSYTTLFQLSRRSRYLVQDKRSAGSISVPVTPANFTYSKHLKKAIHHLEVVLNFIRKNYNENFDKVEVKCIDLSGKSYNNFTILIK